MTYQYRGGARTGASTGASTRPGGGTRTGPTAGAPREALRDQRSSLPAEASAAARIRDAAIRLWGEGGFARVTLKDIAAEAQVSPSVVIHHFDSKAGLRQACDAHVTEVVRRSKSETVQKGHLPRNYVLELMHDSKELILYLFQAFAAGGEETDALFDQLVEDSLEYTAAAEAMGLVSPSADPRRRAVHLLLQTFGAMLLHRQASRHLGVDPVMGPPEDLGPYMTGLMEVYTRPILNPRVYQNLMGAEAEAFFRTRAAAQPQWEGQQRSSHAQDEDETRTEPHERAEEQT